MTTHLIDEMILYSLYCTVTGNNIPEDEKQTQSPESTLKPKHLQEILISLGCPTPPCNVLSWYFSEGEGGSHEDTSCCHALRSQKQHDCHPSATTL